MVKSSESLKVISKKEAISLGLSRFFTGKLCKHGHVSERYISGDCVTCYSERRKKKRASQKPLSIAEVQKLFKYNEHTGELWKQNKHGSLETVNTINAHGYVYVDIGYKNYKAHRIIFMLKGIDPEGWLVDHIDGNRTNNSWNNLRLVTPADNCRNRALPSNNQTGVMGIIEVSGGWRAVITSNCVQQVIGVYSSIDEAIEARKEAEGKLGYHKNHGRDAA